MPAPRPVDPTAASTEGLEPSPVAQALGGLRANEARYFRTKHGHAFTTEPAGPGQPGADLVAWVHGLLAAERDLHIASSPLEATTFVVEGTSWTYVFYASGLVVNVLYGLEDGAKRAVGFKLSDGMEVPAELAERFRFARQRSKLAGTIRGSFFVIKGEHTPPRL